MYRLNSQQENAINCWCEWDNYLHWIKEVGSSLAALEWLERQKEKYNVMYEDNVQIRVLAHSQMHWTRTWFSMKDSLRGIKRECVWALWCSVYVCSCVCVCVHGKSVWNTLCSDSQVLVTGQHVHLINGS